jgi:hypothetical protein
MIVGMAGDIMRTRHAVVAAICCCGWLASCSRDANPPPSAAAAAPRFKAPGPARKGPSVEELTAGMATAPTMGKSSLPADLKFELDQRPKIGQVVEINLALVPKVDGGPATVQASGSQGLDATQGDSPFEVAEVAAGEVYRHTLHVTPTMEGVLLVNLTVSLKHDDVSDSQVFFVPVIVDR